jgi:hypothetical protein
MPTPVKASTTRLTNHMAAVPTPHVAIFNTHCTDIMLVRMTWM